MDDNSLWIVTEKEVTEIGIPVNTKGYYYICYGVVLSLKAGLRKLLIAKEIYSEIAAYDSSSCDCVEKCISNTIKSAWEREEKFRDAINNSKDFSGRRPTNSELIAMITKRLRLERKLVIW